MKNKILILFFTVLCLFKADSVYTAPHALYSLLAGPYYTVLGDPTHFAMGSRVTAMGDIDQDGYGDYALTYAVPSLFLSGTVQIFSGRNRNVLYTHAGTQPWDFFGSIFP